MGPLAAFVVDAAVTIAAPDRIVAQLLDLCDAATVPFTNVAELARRLRDRADDSHVAAATWRAAEPDLDEDNRSEAGCVAA